MQRLVRGVGPNGITNLGGQVGIQPRLTCGFIGALAVHVIAPLTANYGSHSCTDNAAHPLQSAQRPTCMVAMPLTISPSVPLAGLGPVAGLGEVREVSLNQFGI